MKELAKRDLFFLLVYVLGVKVADNDWCFDRCREFQSDPDGYLDLWPRDHFKTTIITVAGSIQEILRDPEITIGIFSFNRSAAKACLRSIKWHFESNEKLKYLFPEVCYENPANQSPKWSEDEGIIVKRNNFVKEATVEAWGLIDSMPTGKHYALRVYDDVVTADSVNTVDMIKKTTDAFALSMNLGSSVGGIDRKRAVGTRYSYNDTYSELMRRKVFKERIYMATKDGKIDGEPWLFTKEMLQQKIEAMGPYIASCQLFNSPIMDGDQVFREEDLRFWDLRMEHLDRMNIYIVVDPANEKKTTSDYTVMWVVGLAGDGNYYVIDCVRDRLSPDEKIRALFNLVREYKPKNVGYEKYGMQSDIEMMKMEMARELLYFNIVPLGGNVKKNDRIKKLQPLFAAHKIYLPTKLYRVDSSGKTRDYIEEFIKEEYLQFPYMKHDDMLDCLARILDEKLETWQPQLQSSIEIIEGKEDTEYDYDVYGG